MHKWFLYCKHFQILQVRDSHSKLHATSCPVGLSMCTVVWAVLPGSKVPHDEPSLQTYGALISWSRISRLHQFVWCCKLRSVLSYWNLLENHLKTSPLTSFLMFLDWSCRVHTPKVRSLLLAQLQRGGSGHTRIHLPTATYIQNPSQFQGVDSTVHKLGSWQPLLQLLNQILKEDFTTRAY